MKRILSAVLLVLSFTEPAMAKILLKQSTAVTVRLGPFLDKTDGVTPETALGGNGGNIETNVSLSKAGGTFGARSSTTDPVYDASGWYSLALNASDTNTLGSLVVQCSDAATYLPVWADFRIVDAASYASEVEGVEYVEGQRVWHVNATSGSDANPGSPSNPLQTLSGAVTAASAGDMLRLHGAFTTRLTISKPLRVVGDGELSTFIVLTGVGGAAIELTDLGASNTYISDLLCSSTGGTNAVGLDATSAKYCTFERMTIGGEFDGVQLEGSIGCTIRECKVSGTYDGGNWSGASGALVENSWIETSGAWSTSVGAHAIYADLANLTVRNSTIRAARTTAATAPTVGIAHNWLIASGYNRAAGRLLVENCEIDVTSTHASATGDVAAVSYDSGFASDPIFAELRGCSIHTSEGGATQTDYHILTNAGSVVMATALKYDPAKVSGAGFYLNDGPLRPTTNGRTLDVSAAGEAGIDWANIGSPGSPQSLTATTIGTSDLLVTTTIATLASQTSFTLANGSADNDAYNGALAIITDATTSNQKCRARVLDYVGASKTVTLAANPAIFTIAVGDSIAIVAVADTTVTAANVDEDHTWRFDSPTQMTAPNDVNEIVGSPSVLAAMDFDEVLPAGSAIDSITTVSVADVTGETEPIVTSSAIHAAKRKVVINFDTLAATDGTYTVSVKIGSTDNQTFTRKGRLVLEAQ